MNSVPELPNAPESDVATDEVAHHPLTTPVPHVHEPRKRTLWQRLTNNRFLFISIIAHVVFGLAAAAWVVQTVTAKRKLNFTSAPPSPNPSQRATEHKVQMAQKQKTMSAPAQPKRITSTNTNVKVTLPEMPAMPAVGAVLPGKMAGMGGAGVAGLGAPGTMGLGGGGGGGPVPLFGLKQLAGGSLAGTFYDLKQDRGRKETGMNPDKYLDEVTGFVRGGWAGSRLQKFYRAPNQLHTTQVFVPDLDAREGPKAFEVEKEVQPRLWVVHYEGKVIPSESGTFHFVGNGDDILCVRFNGKTVLDGSWAHDGKSPLARKEGTYSYGWPIVRPAADFIKGEAIRVNAGQAYPIEILIGERPGGKLHYCLLIEKEGVTYEKDGKGNPKLPVFKMGASKMDKSKGNFPPFADDTTWSVWAAQKPLPTGGSALDIFKR